MRAFCHAITSILGALAVVFAVTALALTASSAMGDQHPSPDCTIDNCHCEQPGALCVIDPIVPIPCAYRCLCIEYIPSNECVEF